MWSQWVRDARGELTHLRAVTGKKGATDKDHAVQGRTRALEYLTGGTATLEALGEPMIAALLAAVGPAQFEVTTEGRRLLKKIAGASTSTASTSPQRKETRDDDTDEPRVATHGNLFDDDKRDEPAEGATDEALDDTVSASSDSIPAVDLALWDSRDKELITHKSMTDMGGILYGKPVVPLIVALHNGDKKTREFFLRAIIVAAEVISKDTLRKHLT